MESDHLPTGLQKAAKAALVILLSIFFVIITLTGVLALSIEAPTSITEGESATISASGQGAVQIEHSGNIVATGTTSTTYTFSTNSTSQGTLEFRISDDLTTSTHELQVHDRPLELEVTSPMETSISSSAIRFAAKPNWPAETCWINIDSSSHALQAQDGEYAKTVTLSDGIYEVTYKCKLHDEVAQEQLIVTVDTHSPVITSAGPTGTKFGPYVTLSADTDEISICKYSAQDEEYLSMDYSMGDTYALKHAKTLELPAESHTFFLRCIDVHGNEQHSSEIVSFLLQNGPTARIFLDQEEPLPAGTYEVQLTSSIALAEQPKLTYTYQESKQTGSIGLTGSGTEWEGYLSIPENTAEGVITFSFEGKSTDGIKGDQITKGAVWKIDAKPPAAIQDLRVINASEHILLTWEELDEDVLYNIYRSETEGVTHADYYGAAHTAQYTDMRADGAKYYYYRIAAVDESGNIGPLSEEKYASVIENLMNNKTLSVIDPLIKARLEDELVALKTSELDVNQTIKRLASESDAATQRVIEDMDLLGKSRALLSKIDLQEDLMQSLLDRAPSVEESDSAIAKSRALREEIKSTLIKRITLESETESKQPTDLQSLESNIAYPLTGSQLSSKEKDDYLSGAIDIQDRVTVSVKARAFTLIDYSNSQRSYTVVEKDIALDTPANDLRVIEVIPKEVASSASDIQFSKEPVVLEDDPVVQYTYPVLERESFRYIVNKLVPMEEVKRSRTLIYPKPSQSSAQPAEQEITGLVTGFDLPEMGKDHLLVVMGIMIVLGLAVYYVSLSTESTPFTPKSAPRMPAVPKRPARVVSRPLPRREAPKSTNPKKMLRLAEEHIDEKDYDSAIVAYQKAKEEMENDEVLAGALLEEESRVRAKLGLHESLSQAKEALERKDIGGARKALQLSREDAKIIGDEETTLISEAKRTYTAFVQELNRLEIEDVAKY